MLGATALSAAAAFAVPFGELPSRPVSDTATCLRATGLPGELVRRTDAGPEFLRAGADGVTATGRVAGAINRGCPRAAARPNGAAIVAWIRADVGDHAESVVAALREPGGAWGPAHVLWGGPELADGSALAGAVSDRGDAVVALAEGTPGVRITVARRAPGGAFQAPQTLFEGPRTLFAAATVKTSMSASGEAVVAWSLRPRPTGPRALWVAVAAPGAAFGAPVKVGELRRGSPFDLAVADDGRALLAFAGADKLLVAERPPGGPFGAAAPVGSADDPFAVVPTAAVGAGGRAVVAWLGGLEPRLRAVTRAAAGPFGAPSTVAPGTSYGYPRDFVAFLSTFAGLGSEYGVSDSGVDDDAANPRALLTGDGRALLTWGAIARRGGLWWLAPHSALLPITGATAEVRAYGSELRDVGSLAPVALAGGGIAVAWTTEGPWRRDGRVHLAAEGAADAGDPPPPRVRVGRPGRVTQGSAIRVPITCSAACVVRGQAGRAIARSAVGSLSLRRGGRGILRLESTLIPLAGMVRVELRYGAPGARTARAAALTVRVRPRAQAPLPRVTGASARRDGDDVVVTWRTSADADDDDLQVSATAGRDTPSLGTGAVRRGPRRWRARIRDVGAARFVSVFLVAQDFRSIRRAQVRIRG